MGDNTETGEDRTGMADSEYSRLNVVFVQITKPGLKWPYLLSVSGLVPYIGILEGYGGEMLSLPEVAGRD